MKDLDALMREALSAKLEREFTATIMGPTTPTTTTFTSPENAISAASVLAMMANMPPLETWVVSRIFPPDVGWRIATPKETFHCFNDMTWPSIRARLASALGEHVIPTPKFIDPRDSDDEGTADWRRRQRERILESIGEAMSGTAAR